MKPKYFPSEKLEDVLKWAYNNKFSSFHKKRLSDILPKIYPISYEKWEEIPLLEREEITSVPFWKRVFVPRSDVPIIRNTYGTSERRIVVTPRSFYGDYSDPFITMKMRRVMSFFASSYTGYPRGNISMDIQTWSGDVGDLNISAKIASEANIDSLYITPYTAIVFAPLLQKYSIIKNIKTVMLTGERCSPLQFKNIRSFYTNATVFSSYAMSETRDTIAIPHIHNRENTEETFIVNSVPEIYCEIVNPADGSVINDYGIPGELVITTLVTGVTFPLIRYRTSDIAVYTKYSSFHGKQTYGFRILGRTTVFPVRMTKGELTAESVEEALTSIPEINPEYFEAHYLEEEDVNKKLLPKVLVTVVTRSNKEIDKKKITQSISDRLLVFPTYTYSDGVREGIYMPLQVSFISTIPKSPLGKQKPPIVVRHTSDTEKTETHYVSNS